jgi:hypothetical protein
MQSATAFWRLRCTAASTDDRHSWPMSPEFFIRRCLKVCRCSSSAALGAVLDRSRSSHLVSQLRFWNQDVWWPASLLRVEWHHKARVAVERSCRSAVSKELGVLTLQQKVSGALRTHELINRAGAINMLVLMQLHSENATICTTDAAVYV